MTMSLHCFNSRIFPLLIILILWELHSFDGLILRSLTLRRTTINTRPHRISFSFNDFDDISDDRGVKFNISTDDDDDENDGLDINLITEAVLDQSIARGINAVSSYVSLL